MPLCGFSYLQCPNSLEQCEVGIFDELADFEGYLIVRQCSADTYGLRHTGCCGSEFCGDVLSHILFARYPRSFCYLFTRGCRWEIHRTSLALKLGCSRYSVVRCRVLGAVSQASEFNHDYLHFAYHSQKHILKHYQSPNLTMIWPTKNRSF